MRREKPTTKERTRYFRSCRFRLEMKATVMDYDPNGIKPASYPPPPSLLPTIIPCPHIPDSWNSFLTRDEAFYSIMVKVQIILGEVILWFKCSKNCKWLMMGFFLLGADFERRYPVGESHQALTGYRTRGKTSVRSCFWSGFLLFSVLHWTCHECQKTVT